MAAPEDHRIEELLRTWRERCVRDLTGKPEGSLDEYLATHPELPPETARTLRRLDSDLTEMLEPGRRRELRAELPAGTCIGPYRLDEVVGRGSYGTVYRGRDPALAIDVAVKVLHGPFLPQDALRFEKEARLLARVSHESVCRVLGAGVQDGLAWLAMRFVPGTPLSRLLVDRTRPRPPRAEILAGAAKLARGLHAVHAAGVLHRDVKSSNIIVTDGGQPVLVDFGLARDTAAGTTTLTGTSDVLGSIGYMAPEQTGIQAGRPAIDARSDVFALAVVVFEWISGQRLFPSESLADYQRALRRGAPSLQSVLPDGDPDLGGVLARALSFDPRDRPATAAELAEALERLARGEASGVRAPGTVLRLRRWAARYPVVAGFALSLFLVLTGALAVTLVLLAQARSAERATARQAYVSAVRGAASSLETGDALEAALELRPYSTGKSFEVDYLRGRIETSGWRLLAGRPLNAAACLSPDRYLIGEGGTISLVERVAGTGAPDGQPYVRRELAVMGGEASVYRICADTVKDRWVAIAIDWRNRDTNLVLASGSLTTGEPIRRTAVSIRHPRASAVLATDVWLVRDDEIVRWSGLDGSWTVLGAAPATGLTTVHPSPCGRYLAVDADVAGAGRQLTVLTHDCRVLWHRRLMSVLPICAGFSPDGNRLVVASAIDAREETSLDAFATASGTRLGSATLRGQAAPYVPTLVLDEAVGVMLANGVMHWRSLDLAHCRGVACVLDAARDGEPRSLWFEAEARTFVAAGSSGSLVAGQPNSAWSRTWLEGRLLASMAFDATGDRLAVSSRGTQVHVFDLTRGGDRSSWKFPHAGCTVGFRPGSGGLELLGQSGGGRLSLDSGATEASDENLQGALIEQPNRALCWEKSAAGLGLTLRWGPAGHSRPEHLGVIAATPAQFATSQDGRVLGVLARVGSDEPGEVWVAERGRGRLRRVFRQPGLTAVAVSPDGQSIAVGLRSGAVTVLAAHSGAVTQHWPVSARAIKAMAWFPSEHRRLVVGDVGNTVYVLGLDHDRVLLTLSGGASPILALAVAPRGDRIACLRSSGVDLWPPLTTRCPDDRARQRREAERLVARSWLCDDHPYGALHDVPADHPRRADVESVVDADLGLRDNRHALLGRPLWPVSLRRCLAATVLRRPLSNTAALDREMAEFRQGTRPSIGTRPEPANVWGRAAFAASLARLGRTADARAVLSGPSSLGTAQRLEAECLAAAGPRRDAWEALEAALAAAPGCWPDEICDRLPASLQPEAKAILGCLGPLHAGDDRSTSTACSLAWTILRAPGRDADLYRAAVTLAHRVAAVSSDPSSTVALAAAHWRSGRHEDARSLLEDQSHRLFGDARSVFLLAMIHRERADHAAAVAQVEILRNLAASSNHTQLAVSEARSFLAVLGKR